MRIIDPKYLVAFSKLIAFDLAKQLEQNTSDQKKIPLDFRIKTSAVYSSNIEGNPIDVNSFLNSEVAKEAFKPQKEMDEVSDLVNSYQFAIVNDLSEANVLEAHRLLSSTLLIADKRGHYRTDRMGIYSNTGLVYLAVEPQKVNSEMATFFADVQSLLETDLSLAEVFYHASLIHLKLAQIHPFMDGNGRTARLVEKWFLAKKNWYKCLEGRIRTLLQASYGSVLPEHPLRNGLLFFELRGLCSFFAPTGIGSKTH